MANRSPKTVEDWAIRLADSTRSSDPLSEDERDALARWLVADPDRLKQLKTAQLIWQLGGRLTAESAVRIEAHARAAQATAWSPWKGLQAAFRPPALAGF